METLEIVTKNEKETLTFAKKLASILQKKDIIILSGDLGAGKTKFTEGILTYFGLEKEISSPTFTIVNEYLSHQVSIYHFDVYRLEDSSEFYEIGGEEYFQKGICLIEWGELIQDALPKEYLEIHFKKDELEENTRILTCIPHGDRWEKEENFENIMY